MTIVIHKGKARCVRCGLFLSFSWWKSKSKQRREFTAIHDSIVKLRMENNAGKNVTLNDCGRVVGLKQPAKKKIK